MPSINCALRTSVSSLSAAIVLSLGSPAIAQVASALLREDAQLSGALAGQNVSGINNSAVNHAGGYSFTVNTSDGVTTLSHAWGNPSGGGPGTVLRTEGTFGSLTQTAYESFFGMADSGAIGYGATCTDGAFTGLDAVWVGDVPVAVERDPVPSMPGQFWVFNSRPGITADGRLYWGAGISSVQGGATQNRGLFIDAAATPLYLGGQTPPGLPFPINGGTIDFDYRVSALATHWIAPLTMTTGSTANDGTILLDGEGLQFDRKLVREGSPIPASAGGLAGENWGLFDFVGITESGEYFFTGNSNAATTQDESVVINGQIIYREGQSLDGQTLTGDIEGGYMNEDGDVALTWDIVGPTAALEALILNGRIVLVEGDMVDLDGDGVVEPNSILRDFTGISALTLSDRDAKGNVNLYFTADIDTFGTTSTLDDVEGGFCLTVPAVPCPADIAPVGGDNQVNVSDLLAVVASWGACPGCAADINGDGAVNVTDLLLVVGAWGACD